MTIKRLTLESVVVAIATVVAFFAIHVPVMQLMGPSKSMQHGMLALQIAIAAALVHIVSEFSGVNTWYCKTR